MSLDELIAYLITAFSAIALAGIVTIILLVYSICLALKYKNDCESRCLGTRCMLSYFICYFLVMILVWTATALTWPRSYERTYKGATWADSPDTLRMEGVRVGMHIGMLHRVSIDCEDALSQHEASSVTIENALKWGKLEQGDTLDVAKYDWTAVDSAVVRIRAHNHYLRGHALVWDSLKLITPSALNAAISGPQQQDEALEAMSNHFNAVMLRYKDITRAWDVVNEPLKGDPPSVSGEYQGPLFRAFGERYIDESFRLARDIQVAHNLTDTLLFLNEAFPDYSLDNSKIVAFLELLDRLKARNVSFDCVGIQAHGFYQYPDEESVAQFVEQIVARGFCFEFTEIDARLRLFGAEKDPYDAQGQLLSMYFKICAQYNRTVCPGVTLWGVTDITAWYDAFPPYQVNRPNEPFLHDQDGERKPGWKHAIDILRSLPNSTGNGNIPFAPKLANVTTSLTQDCSGDDLIYKQGEWIYIVLMCFSVWLPIAVVVWIVVWNKSRSMSVKVYEKTETTEQHKRRI